MNALEKNKKTPVKLLIVEDHELSRYGLNMSLSEKEGLNVIGEAENGKQGLELTLEKKPDVVLMDIGMPVMDGIEATQKIKEKQPDTKVIMLTSIQNHDEVLAAMAGGADAYCLKDIKLDSLYNVIQTVMEGAIWLDPAIARMVMQTLPASVTPDVSSAAPHSEEKAKRVRYNTELTDRERETLKLIVDGKSNKEMAVILNVSPHTVKAHVSALIQKLAVDDRTQVAVKALRDGLV